MGAYMPCNLSEHQDSNRLPYQILTFVCKFWTAIQIFSSLGTYALPLHIIRFGHYDNCYRPRHHQNSHRTQLIFLSPPPTTQQTVPMAAQLFDCSQ